MGAAQLQAGWNSTALPQNANGTPLSSTMTTAEKAANVNAWWMPGAPSSMIIPTYKIYNLMASSEIGGLSATQAQNIRDILTMGTVDVSVGTNARTRISQNLSTCAQTMANLIALATTFDTPHLPWITSSTVLGGAGMPGPINTNDAAAFGLS